MKEYKGSVWYSLSLVNVFIATFSMLSFVATTEYWLVTLYYVATSYMWFFLQTRKMIK